jgi:alginate O-acetyltransferase complex protein AlgI
VVFTSLQFLVFFSVVFTAYLSLAHRGQNRFLLIASYVFYASWDARFLILILVTTLTDFICAKRIHATSDKSIRKRYVAVSCCINLGILGFFKYFNFFVDNFVLLFESVGISLSPPVLTVLLPVGISFYTFQSISYTIDVYRKQVTPANNFLDYALYVSFFPQLVAGPIERGKNLLPQILAPRGFSIDRFKQGVFLICLGIFKKLYIADNLAAFVDPVFAQGANPSGTAVLVAGYAFLFQIYCDFSAYTDIARGVSKMMGFELMENFRAPYLARNVQDFWNRWHISLTTWIRDYLYYPLAFKRFRKRSIPPAMVTVITFSLMGLWHGAGWGYILWGIYNGIALALYGQYARRSAAKRSPKTSASKASRRLVMLFQIALTFHVILIGDLFFRSSSLEQSGFMILALFTDFSINVELFTSLAAILPYVLPIFIIDLLTVSKPAEVRIFAAPRLLRYGLLYTLFALVIVYGTTSPSFIYFQF